MRILPILTVFLIATSAQVLAEDWPSCGGHHIHSPQKVSDYLIAYALPEK